MRFVILLFFSCILLFSYGDVLAFHVSPAIPEEGSLTPYFCGVDDCETVLVEVLSFAQEEISCAFFDVDLDSVLDLFDAKHSAGVDVRLVVDNENKFGARDYLIYDDSKQYMHHKFCVVDDFLVVTGSMNPTHRGARVNQNNLVVFSSRHLAFSFLQEFNELWSGEFGSGKQTYFPSTRLGGVLVTSYFCPEDGCEDLLVGLLEEATRVHFMTFSFTSDPIGGVLLGKDVSGLFDRQLGLGSEFDRLSSVSSTYSGDGKLHHKVFIIDERVVVLGSYNPTHRGGYVNDEVMLVVDDVAFAQAFIEEFYRLS